MSASYYIKPAFDGSISLADIVDFNLDVNSEWTYAYLPSDSGEPLCITWLEFARAVHRGAHIINPLGDGTNHIGTRKVIAIFSVTDTLVYLAMVFAIIRSGNIPFPISHRNTPAAVISVMSRTSCRYLMIGDSPSLSDRTRELLRELDSKTFEVTTINMPSYHDLFPNLGKEKADGESFIRYPCVEHLSQDDIVMILHSSGSTGLPKPIPYTQKFVLDMLQTPMVQQIPANSVCGTGHLPPFHLAGIYSDLIQPMGSGTSIVLFQLVYPGTLSVTPEATIDLFSKIKIDCLMTVPSFLVAWAKDEQAIGILQKLKFIYWGGGPLPTDVGNYLASRDVPLCIFYAGTEFSFPTIPKAINRGSGRDADDWLYVEFMDKARVRWAPQNGDEGIYEFQCLDSPFLPPAIHNFVTPEGPAYSTSDLFVPHPTKAGLWRIVGRADDQVILSLGEKINPGPIEDFILKSSSVSGVVLFGRAKEQAGILVEPISGKVFDTSDMSALSKFRNEIWPYVEAANVASPSFARIFKEMILVTSPNKPLFRTPKSTIMRKASLRSYESEIEQIYTIVDDSKGNDIKPPSIWDIDGIQEWLTGNILELLDRREIDIDVDFFEQGADSLSATYMRNRLIGAMRRSTDITIKDSAKRVDHSTIFSYPTIRSLTRHVVDLINRSDASGGRSGRSKETAVRAMQEMIQKYTKDLPSTKKNEQPLNSLVVTREVVLLTGSTGALGSQLLAQMLRDERIEKIYAVNRYSSIPIKERQKQSFEDKDLDVSLLENIKLVYVETDTSKHLLGLEEEFYQEISSSVTIIIHNAWRLDFNLSLASFESHVRGTRNIVDLAIYSTNSNHIRVIFTSSIATLSSWDKVEKVPEEPIADAKYSVGNGYGESKYVTEKILEKATTLTGIQTSIFRVGQLSGGRCNNGAWALTDWVPIILASSLKMGCLPDARGVISWLPLDSAAAAILDVSLERRKMMEQTYHLWHPRPSKWSDIFKHASTALQPFLHGKALDLVPFYEWHHLLQQTSISALVEDFTQNPGLKLVEFFQTWAEGDRAMYAGGSDRDYHEVFGQAEIATEKIVAASQTMKDVEPLSQEDVCRWILYWSKKGLFN